MDYSSINLNDKPDNTKDKELYLYKLFAAFRNSNYQQGKYIYELGKTKTDFTSMDRITLEIDLFQKALKEELNLSFDLDLLMKKLRNELSPQLSKDYLVSRGEYITAQFMAEYLGYTFVDAKDVIVLEYDGKINYEVTSSLLNVALEKYKTIVVPGFYAVTPDKEIRLFSRGGSDITGSIIAKSVSADLYENWTDVNGIYTASPSIIKDVTQIEEITYRELRELS